jgi:hypothetical protein
MAAIAETKAKRSNIAFRFSLLARSRERKNKRH